MQNHSIESSLGKRHHKTLNFSFFFHFYPCSYRFKFLTVATQLGFKTTSQLFENLTLGMISCKLLSSLHKLSVVTTNEQLVLNDLNAKAEIKTTKADNEGRNCVCFRAYFCQREFNRTTNVLNTWSVSRQYPVVYMGWIHFIVGGLKAIQLIYTIQHNNNKIRKKTLYQIESMETAQSTLCYEMKETFQNYAKVV